MTPRDWIYAAGLVITIGIQLVALGKLVQKVKDHTDDILGLKDTTDEHDRRLNLYGNRIVRVETKLGLQSRDHYGEL